MEVAAVRRARRCRHRAILRRIGAIGGNFPWDNRRAPKQRLALHKGAIWR
jgi:hypothetical protein